MSSKGEERHEGKRTNTLNYVYLHANMSRYVLIRQSQRDKRKAADAARSAQKCSAL